LFFDSILNILKIGDYLKALLETKPPKKGKKKEKK